MPGQLVAQRPPDLPPPLLLQRDPQPHPQPEPETRPEPQVGEAD